MPESQIIIGIDPGSLKAGFGLIRKNNLSHVTHVAHGIISLDKKKSISERLGDLAFDLNFLISKYQPSLAVVEDVFFYQNARSALILGQARGVVLAVFSLANIPIATLSPTAVKLRIAGSGRARKFQVAHMVALELGITIPEAEDASDALALALAQVR